MRRTEPRVFTIPPAAPFLPTLVDRLTDGTLVDGFPDKADPFALARATILLPTRRACRALVETFRQRAATAVVLPRIRPLGDVDEDDFDLSAQETDDTALDLPETVAPMQRRLALARLVLGWGRAMRAGGADAGIPASPADAVHLADELARLMDSVATEGASFDALRDMLPDALQEHWQITLRFLDIATQAWPRHLAEIGRIEPAERRRLLMEAEAVRLARSPPGVVVAAGSTGSIPSTARLLATIARLPLGAVVLPGLDQSLDEAAWDALRRTDPGAADPVPSHPQTTLRALLDTIGIARAEVRPLVPACAREVLFSEVMRPAETTEAWSRRRLAADDVIAALDGVVLIEAQNEREEALAAALALRETLETPGHTAALVTPDRTLARRVAAELTRFGVVADDSAGRPLGESRPGVLARLIADVARDRFAPVPLLALLKHPLTTFGEDAAAIRRAARVLERLVFRGATPAPGSDALRRAFATRDARFARERVEAARALTGDAAAAQAAAALLDRVLAVLEPLERLFAGEDEHDLAILAAAHEAALDAVVGAGADDPLDDHEDGRELRLLFAEIAEAAPGMFAVPGRDYAALFGALLAGHAVRRVYEAAGRVHIYGLLEARLIHHDRLVLAGLDEGVWPQTTRTDPWLSRLMRKDLHLPAPERRIGLSAHDFVQTLGARDVVVTRALKSAGTPTVPSRWLQRLQALAGPHLDEPRRRGRAILDVARTLDHAPRERITAPNPRPPPAVRPRTFSVTDFERLVRDPYAVYARRVLKLRPFEPIAADPGAAERGTLVHAVLAEGARAANRGEALDIARMRRIIDAELAPFSLFPELAAFWRMRLERIAAWFVAHERELRTGGVRIVVEVDGRLKLGGADRPFELTARADRFEVGIDGRVTVIDYKTTKPPTNPAVLAGLAPQLPLEAAMIAGGAFAQAGLGAAREVAGLAYVHVSGGDPPARIFTCGPKDATLTAFVETTLASAIGLLDRFDDPKQGYPSRAGSKHAPRYNDYAHLARFAEWGVATDGDGE